MIVNFVIYHDCFIKSETQHDFVIRPTISIIALTCRRGDEASANGNAIIFQKCYIFVALRAG